MSNAHLGTEAGLRHTQPSALAFDPLPQVHSIAISPKFSHGLTTFRALAQHEACYRFALMSHAVPSTHAEFLALWGVGAYAQISRELAQRGLVISGMGVARWAQNDFIPGEYWADLAALAEERSLMLFTPALKLLATYGADQYRRRREESTANENVGAS